MTKPFVPLVCFYILGIVAGEKWTHPIELIEFICFFLLVGFLISLLFNQKKISTVFSFLVFFILGSLMSSFSPLNEKLPASVLNFIGKRLLNIEGTICNLNYSDNYEKEINLSDCVIHFSNYNVSIPGKILLKIRYSLNSYDYGDRIRFWGTLRLPRNFSNPGGFDYVKYLRLDSIQVLCYLRDDRAVVKVAIKRLNPFILFVEKIRHTIRLFLNENIDFPQREILKALIIGDKYCVPKEIQRDFRKLGLSHLLVISGLHIGIIAFVSFVIIRACLRISTYILLHFQVSKIATFCSLFPILFYCLIAGFRLPTIRATIMVSVYIISLLLERKEDLLQTLAIAAFLILVVSPSSLFDVSFQLSLLLFFQ